MYPPIHSVDEYSNKLWYHKGAVYSKENEYVIVTWNNRSEPHRTQCWMKGDIQPYIYIYIYIYIYTHIYIKPIPNIYIYDLIKINYSCVLECILGIKSTSVKKTNGQDSSYSSSLQASCAWGRIQRGRQNLSWKQPTFLDPDCGYTGVWLLNNQAIHLCFMNFLYMYYIL